MTGGRNLPDKPRSSCHCYGDDLDRTTECVGQASQGQRGKPVIGGGVLFKGRPAEKLTAGLQELSGTDNGPYKDLLNPEQVLVDAYDNVHLCQGLRMATSGRSRCGSWFTRTIRSCTQPRDHSSEVDPARLAAEYGLAMNDDYVAEYHLCYTTRKLLTPRSRSISRPPHP